MDLVKKEISPLITNKIIPPFDSTTALQIMKADGINSIAEFDTITGQLNIIGSGIRTTRYSNNFNIIGVRINGTITSPTKVVSGNIIGSFSLNGQYDAVDGNTSAGAQIRATATGDWGSATDKPCDLQFYLASSVSNIVEKMRIKGDTGSILIGLTSEPSGGGYPVILLAQASSNPTGLPADSAGEFSKDVGGTCELFGFDEAGNVNQLTPHYNPELAIAAGIKIDDDDEYPRIGYEENIYLAIEAFTYLSPKTGKYQRIVRPTGKQPENWEENQNRLLTENQNAIEKWHKDKAEHEIKLAEYEAKQDKKESEEPVFGEPLPTEYKIKPCPKWIKDRLDKIK
jgi:hypothetical protein